MNEKKYIEVNALIAECEEEIVDYDFDMQRSFIIKAVPTEYIEAFPAADVEEVKHGRWIEYKYPRHDPRGRAVCMCSVCQEGWDKDDLVVVGKGCLPRCCPNCGAKMDAKEKEAIFINERQ